LQPVNYNFTCEGQENILYTGFIAQEVEQALIELDQDFSGVCRPESEDEFYSLRYAEFVVPLVKGMQEQQVEIEELRSEIDDLKSEIEILKRLGQH
jgi:hypothetical protein